jgi:hypothetical protein
VHASALVEDHVNVVAPPLTTLVGSALSTTVGAGGGGGAACTFTETDRDAVPPAPLQESENVLLAVNGPVVAEPAVGLTPDHAPEATHDVASVDVHVSVAAAPLGMLAGFAFNDTVGTAGIDAASTLTVTDFVSAPPRFVQVNEKFCGDVIGPTDSAPDGGLLPDQAPDATHAFARSEFHRSVAEPLLVTVGGSATKVTIGRDCSSSHETRINAPMAARSFPAHCTIRCIAMSTASSGCRSPALTRVNWIIARPQRRAFTLPR